MDTADLPNQPPRNIVLVGFMGSGKSTLGKILHKRISYHLVDTDHLIEEQAGKNISEIFKSEGEEHFRNLETQLLRDMLKSGCNHHIISTGGGMILREENRALLRQLGFVVWLSCSAEETYQRTARTNTRPLLQCDDPMAVITKMLNECSPLYDKAAHLKISTSDLEFNEIFCGILESARYHFGTHSDDSDLIPNPPCK